MGGVPLAGGAGSDYNGNIIGDDSTIIVNVATKVVTASGGFIGNATSVTNGVYITDTGTVTNTMLAGSIVDTKLSTISTAGKVSNSATTATNANTASAIVSRDGSGNFLANIITSTLIGNVTGDTVGFHTGDVKGSVFANDSTMLINGIDGTLNGTLVTDLIQIPDSSVGIAFVSNTSASFAASFHNGNYATKTPIGTGVSMGAISIKGWNGTTYGFGGAIVASWEAGAVISDDAPLSTVTIASGAGGSSNKFASLDSKGIWLSPLAKTTVYSAAGTAIPSAVTMGQGARAFVSDATVATFTTAYTSGGSNIVPVYSDGTIWRIG
jgi:hypothetical protein